MSIKPVTIAQVEQVRKMAVDKGLSASRFQEFGLNNGSIAAALDSINQDNPIHIGISLIELPEVTICTVRVELNHSLSWDNLVKDSCPNTDERQSSVSKVKHLYPSLDSRITKDELILLNFPEEGDWGQAFHWAEKLRLVETNPRWVFALGKSRPNLERDLGQSRLYVVATEGCFYEGKPLACSVWWDGDSKREAGTNYTSFYCHPQAWFAFRKEI